MVDEFGRVTCEDLIARTEVFAAHIMSEPREKALIVIHPPTIRPELAATRFLLISSTLQLRGLEQDRYAFYRGKPVSTDDIRTQFWKLPHGADPPFTETALWNPEVPDISRPFMFGYEDENGICPTFVPKAFAKLILEDSGSRGHIIVRVGDDPMIDRFYFADGWIKELVEKQGIPRKRLRLFFTKRKGLTGAEFWFVPAQKK